MFQIELTVLQRTLHVCCKGGTSLLCKPTGRVVEKLGVDVFWLKRSEVHVCTLMASLHWERWTIIDVLVCGA